MFINGNAIGYLPMFVATKLDDQGTVMGFIIVKCCIIYTNKEKKTVIMLKIHIKWTMSSGSLLIITDFIKIPLYKNSSCPEWI